MPELSMMHQLLTLQVPAGRACACKDRHGSCCRHHLPSCEPLAGLCLHHIRNAVTHPSSEALRDMWAIGAQRLCPCGKIALSTLHGFLQVATKTGALNIPQWYEAGSVWVKNNPGFPFGMPLTSHI